MRIAAPEALLLLALAWPLWALLRQEPRALLAGGGGVVLGGWPLWAAGLMLLHLVGLLLALGLRGREARARRRAAKVALALLLSLLGAGLLGEGALRLVDERLPAAARRRLGAPQFVASDPRFVRRDGPWGWRGLAGLALAPAPAEPELVRGGRVRAHPLMDPIEEVGVALDAEGFRNPARPAPGEVELLAVGDSFTFGWNLPLEAAWPSRVGPGAYQVACNGWSPSQALLAARAFGLPLLSGPASRPRRWVQTFYPGNDLDEEAAWQVQRARGALPAAGAQAPAGEAPPLRGARLLALLRAGVDLLPPGLYRDPASPRTALAVEVGGRPLAVAFAPEALRALGRAPAEWRAHAGFAPCVEALASGVAEARAAGARACVLLIPTREEALWPLLPEPERRLLLRETFLEAGARAEAELAAVDRVLLQHASARLDLMAQELAARGVEALDLRPALSAAYLRGEPPWFALDSHWSRGGHELAAAAVRAWSASGRD